MTALDLQWLDEVRRLQMLARMCAATMPYTAEVFRHRADCLIALGPLALAGAA